MRASSQITVVLVDDHELARVGVQRILKRDTHIKVVGEASSSNDAISLIVELRPEVAVLDIRLRQGSGLDVIHSCKKMAAKTKMLILSAYDDERYVGPLVRLGVRGYLLKTVSADELRKAVRDVAEGKLVYPQEVADKVLDVLQANEANGRASGQTSLNGSLTNRERDILERMGQGLTNSEIGGVLGISVKTVESHVRHLFLKLGAKNRTQAVLKAL
jgi:DNA-binding NarL/FixJ family response regulator